MQFSTLSILVLAAELASAARFTSQRWERHAARQASRGNRMSSLRMNPTNSTGHEVEAGDEGAIELAQGQPRVNKNAALNKVYSQNWAGSILVGSGYTAVTGTFTVPSPSPPTGGSANTEYAASAWVGIDGDTWTNAILQTGLDFYTWKGQVAFDAWYEWYPDYAYTFSGIGFSVGDVVTLSVQATSKTTGVATVVNRTKGTQVSHTFTTQPQALGQVNAEWIVEDFQQNDGSLVPFANFGTVGFSNAYAYGTSTGYVGPSGGTLVDILQNGVVRTATSVGQTSVVIAYT